jgi:hypothetical protein
MEAYKKLTNGNLEVPTLLVGRELLKGYEEGAWDAALDNAGYPRGVAGARPAPKPAPAPVKPPAAEPNATPAPATSPAPPAAQ